MKPGASVRDYATTTYRPASAAVRRDLAALALARPGAQGTAYFRRHC